MRGHSVILSQHHGLEDQLPLLRVGFLGGVLWHKPSTFRKPEVWIAGLEVRDHFRVATEGRHDFNLLGAPVDVDDCISARGTDHAMDADEQAWEEYLVAGARLVAPGLGPERQQRATTMPIRPDRVGQRTDPETDDRRNELRSVEKFG